MKAFKSIYKGYMALDKALKRVIEVFCGSALLLLTIVVFVCALLRFCFNYSVVGSDEFSQYLMVWVVLCASVLCAETDDFINIDAVFYFLPDKLKPYIRILAHSITCVFLFIFTSYTIDTVERIKVMNTYSVGMPFFPMWLLYLPATFCFLLMGIEYGKLVIKGIHQVITSFKTTETDEVEGVKNETEGGKKK